MSKTEHPILTTTVVATGALARQRFATAWGALPAAGAKVLGVANADYEPGESAGVGVLGIFLVEAGGAIALDAQVQADDSGRAITLDQGADAGRALDAATAVGDVIRIVRGL